MHEYLDLPEMKARYSIIDGELILAAAPTPDHQRVVQEYIREARLFCP